MDSSQKRMLMKYARKLWPRVWPKIKKWWADKNKRAGQQTQQDQWQQPQSQNQWQQQPQPNQWQQQPQQNQWNQPQQSTGQNQSYYGGSAAPTHVNQDMINASSPEYAQLRNQAIQEGDAMHRCFDQASQAHHAGDGRRAKELSTEGHQHQERQKQLDRQAAEWIYNENNKTQSPGSIDLHGLYVAEAIEFTERAIQNAQNQGLEVLRVIVGKGLHSQGHVAKIKPAIEELMIKYNLSAQMDPHNAGVLIVHLRDGQGSRDLSFVDQASRQMPGPDDQCRVM